MRSFAFAVGIVIVLLTSLSSTSSGHGASAVTVTAANTVVRPSLGGQSIDDEASSSEVCGESYGQGPITKLVCADVDLSGLGESDCPARTSAPFSCTSYIRLHYLGRDASDADFLVPSQIVDQWSGSLDTAGYATASVSWGGEIVGSARYDDPPVHCPWDGVRYNGCELTTTVRFHFIMPSPCNVPGGEIDFDEVASNAATAAATIYTIPLQNAHAATSVGGSFSVACAG